MRDPLRIWRRAVVAFIVAIGALALQAPVASASADTTPPAGGAIVVPDGIVSTASVSIAIDPGIDVESGVASWQVYQVSATLSAGSCGTFGGWSLSGPANPIGGITASPANGSCARYRLRVVDGAGNVAWFDSPSTVRVDRTEPYGMVDAPTPGDVLGRLVVTGSAIDVHSPIAGVVVEFSGPVSGTACSTAVVVDGHWSCTWVTGGLPAGAYSLSVRIVDAAGLGFSGGYSAAVQATELMRGIVHAETVSGEDARPPSVGFDDIDPVAWNTRARLRYFGVDWPDVAPSFRVLRRVASAKGGGFGTWTAAPGDASAGLAVGERGDTTCFKVEANDIVGNSAVSEEHCATVPFDDRDLARAGAWKLLRPYGSWRRTVSQAKQRGATLTATYVTARMSLIATTCRACGSVKVMQGARAVATISLRSKRTERQQVIALPGATAGDQLRIVALGNGTVEVDGFVAAR